MLTLLFSLALTLGQTPARGPADNAKPAVKIRVRRRAAHVQGTPCSHRKGTQALRKTAFAGGQARPHHWLYD